MTEITQAQIEIWKRDSEILDRVKKAVETDLNKDLAMKKGMLMFITPMSQCCYS